MGMDRDCNTGFSFGMNSGIGRRTREEDQNYASGIPVNRPPVQLDLFPIAPVLPKVPGSMDFRSSSGTLPREKTSPSRDGGDGSEEETNAGIRPVSVASEIDVNKLSASSCNNGTSAAIIVSASLNNTIYSNAMNPASGHNRKLFAPDELENERVQSRVLSYLEEQCGSKKKLRLSKQHSDILEASFSKNNSPEFNRKQALASQMNLLPRQVEVWFQNRRARTKLKQTEMDCEVLKRCNESLADENRRLHNELQELRALKLASPLTVCPSCAKVAGSGNTAAFTIENVKSILTRGVSPN